MRLQSPRRLRVISQPTRRRRNDPYAPPPQLRPGNRSPRRRGRHGSPPTQFNSLNELFEQIYEHERFITSKIKDLVHLATIEPDYSTLQFLQWYVAEQHQEEFLFKGILDKIELIGTEGQGIFFIDREIATLATNPAKETTSMTPAV